MRELLVQAARIDEADDQAVELVEAFENGQVTSMQATLGVSCAYVECAKAIQMLRRRMGELEEVATRMKEAA